MRSAVLAVLGGVSRAVVARRLDVHGADLARWVDTFIESGTQGLTRITRTPEGDRDPQRDQHLAMIAHELRSPLTMITGWASLAAAAPEDDQLVARALSGINAQAQRLARLAEDTLDATAVSMGTLSLTFCDTSVAALVTRVADARAVDRPVVRVIDDVIAPIDADRIGQVLDNLLENARKHVGEVADVTVSREGDDVVIAIASAGTPIAADVIERMFEPWQRGRTAAGGAGLGLYICRVLVEAHGGEIGVDVDDLGNTFWIRLPAA